MSSKQSDPFDLCRQIDHNKPGFLNPWLLIVDLLILLAMWGGMVWLMVWLGGWK